jgi:hypothetical protein
MFPDVSQATPHGLQNRAAEPVPSVEPDDPANPASVVTTPVEATILRIILLIESAT